MTPRNKNAPRGSHRASAKPKPKPKPKPKVVPNRKPRAPAGTADPRKTARRPRRSGEPDARATDASRASPAPTPGSAPGNEMFLAPVTRALESIPADAGGSSLETTSAVGTVVLALADAVASQADALRSPALIGLYGHLLKVWTTLWLPLAHNLPAHEPPRESLWEQMERPLLVAAGIVRQQLLELRASGSAALPPMPSGDVAAEMGAVLPQPSGSGEGIVREENEPNTRSPASGAPNLMLTVKAQTIATALTHAVQRQDAEVVQGLFKIALKSLRTVGDPRQLAVDRSVEATREYLGRAEGILALRDRGEIIDDIAFATRVNLLVDAIGRYEAPDTFHIDPAQGPAIALTAFQNEVREHIRRFDNPKAKGIVVKALNRFAFADSPPSVREDLARNRIRAVPDSLSIEPIFDAPTPSPFEMLERLNEHFLKLCWGW